MHLLSNRDLLFCRVILCEFSADLPLHKCRCQRLGACKISCSCIVSQGIVDTTSATSQRRLDEHVADRVESAGVFHDQPQQGPDKNCPLYPSPGSRLSMRFSFLNRLSVVAASTSVVNRIDQCGRACAWACMRRDLEMNLEG
jgi:hypothetical protein